MATPGPALAENKNTTELHVVRSHLALGAVAFRVMTDTEGDDIYVAYDEMDKKGVTPTSRARAEHYRITP